MEELTNIPEIASRILLCVPYKSLIDTALRTGVSTRTFSSLTSNRDFWNERLRLHLELPSYSEHIYSIDHVKAMEELVSKVGEWRDLIRHACQYDLVEIFEAGIEKHMKLMSNPDLPGILTGQVDRVLFNAFIDRRSATLQTTEVILLQSLEEAIVDHSINVFKRILEYKWLNIQKPNKEAILTAVRDGTYEMVELLMLDPRCDPSTPNNNDAGSNAVLWQCVQKDRVDVLKLLLTDSRVDITDYNYGIIEDARAFGGLHILDFLSDYPLTRDRI